MRADVERSADLVHRWRSHLGEIEQRAAALESAADEQTAWLADHADDIAAAQALVRADETAIRHRVQAAEFQPPAYLLDVIGPRPDDPTERRAWRHAATEIERYRTAHAVTDPDRALGDAPADSTQRTAYTSPAAPSSTSPPPATSLNFRSMAATAARRSNSPSHSSVSVARDGPPCRIRVTHNVRRRGHPAVPRDSWSPSVFLKRPARTRTYGGWAAAEVGLGTIDRTQVARAEFNPARRSRPRRRPVIIGGAGKRGHVGRISRGDTPMSRRSMVSTGAGQVGGLSRAVARHRKRRRVLLTAG